MSVSDALVAKCTQSVKLAENLKIRLQASEDNTLRSERELIAWVVESLAICVKALQLEVIQLGRQLEDVCGKSTR